MHRFKSNRLWILILALVLSVAGVVSMPSAGYADKGSDGTIGNDDSSGDLPPPDPQGAGDPDSPSGSGRSNLQAGGDVFYGTTGTVGVGDTSARRVAPVVMRLRIALGMLKYYYLRF